MKSLNLQIIKKFIYSHQIEIILGILVGVISGSLTNFIWQNNIFAFSIGVVTGLIFSMFYHKFFYWLTSQSWFPSWILKWFSKKKIPLWGREKEIRRLIGEIKTGQSSIIVGIFGSERTAILDYLREVITGTPFIFSYLNIGPIAGDAQKKLEFGTVQFWEDALKPLLEEKNDDVQNEFKSFYEESKKRNFEHSSLETLFEQIDQKGWRLVLMIDRFHKIAHLDKLNDPSFFASLRALGSHANGPLSLILTIGESEQLLQLRTLDPGKLYEFNFMNEITLGALPEEQIEDLLAKNGITVTEERLWIKECAGGHPYLLKKAIELLNTTDRSRTFLSKFFFTSPKLETMKDQFLEEIVERELLQKNLIAHTDMCNALFSVVEGKVNMTHFKALNELRRQGFLDKSNEQWKIHSPVIAAFLSKKVQEKDQLCGVK